MKTRNLVLGGLALLLCAGLGARSARSEWTDTVKVYGDLRYRYEEIQDESQTGAGKSWYRERDRIRARLGVTSNPDDYWKVDIRLATSEAGFAGGNGDPISVNQTLGDVDTKKPIWLDLAYMEYKLMFNNLKLTAGKMPIPWETVGKNKFLWKDDLTPEGIAGKFTVDIMEGTSFFVNGGGIWMREVSAGYDPMLYFAQAGVKATVMDGLKVTGGVGEFYYTDMTKQYPYDYKTGSPTSITPGAGSGNDIVAATGKYADNYYLTEGFLAADTSIFDMPLTLYADYSLNNGATHFQKGYVAGFILNKAKSEGSWEFGYNWRLIEKNALVGAFSDSDFAGGGTDASGHMLTAGYMITDAVRGNLTFFRDQKKLSAATQTYYNRFQAEVVVSF
jgi:hypothetical protein